MWFIGVEVEQETSAPPPKKKSWIRLKKFTTNITKESDGSLYHCTLIINYGLFQ